MRLDFDIEYKLLQTIIKQKDLKIEELRDSLKKLMHMLRYPRLVEMLNKQLNYERVEFFVPRRSKSSQIQKFETSLEELSDHERQYLVP